MTENNADNRNEKCFEVSLRLRNFEIELFWKRALFFWGFIASAFAGFIALKTNYSNYAFLVASFGFICSLCWSLTNRGSKRWHENWEQRSALYGKTIVGDLLIEISPIQTEKGWWLRARNFSPSKLTIALSDYTTFLWLVIIIGSVIHIDASIVKPTLCIITVAYAIAIMWFARSGGKSDGKK